MRCALAALSLLSGLLPLNGALADAAISDNRLGFVQGPPMPPPPDASRMDASKMDGRDAEEGSIEVGPGRLPEAKASAGSFENSVTFGLQLKSSSRPGTGGSGLSP